MKVSEALQVMGFESGMNVNKELVAKTFKKLSFQFHPDQGGSNEKMILLLDARKTLLEKMSESWFSGQKASECNIADLMQEVLDKIQHLQGLELTIAGSWLWVDGKTKQYSKLLGKTGAGLHWHSRKNKWYWHPPETGKKKKYWKGKKSVPMDKIYSRYGRQDIPTVGREKIN